MIATHNTITECIWRANIFEEFSEEKAPNKIARDLNEEGIPGPRGNVWSDTTVHGHMKRSTGIINNERYIGQVIWNRQRFIKNPQNGKRVARLNPERKWIKQIVPELRIISDNLWKSVKARQEIIEKQANRKCPNNNLNGARPINFYSQAC